jgi:hypothetical protein
MVKASQGGPKTPNSHRPGNGEGGSTVCTVRRHPCWCVARDVRSLRGVRRTVRARSWQDTNRDDHGVCRAHPHIVGLIAPRGAPSVRYPRTLRESNAEPCTQHLCTHARCNRPPPLDAEGTAWSKVLQVESHLEDGARSFVGRIKATPEQPGNPDRFGRRIREKYIALRGLEDEFETPRPRTYRYSKCIRSKILSCNARAVAAVHQHARSSAFRPHPRPRLGRPLPRPSAGAGGGGGGGGGGERVSIAPTVYPHRPTSASRQAPRCRAELLMRARINDTVHPAAAPAGGG